MLSALGVTALVLIADPGGALDRSSGCWWVPTHALEEWLGARMDRASNHSPPNDTCVSFENGKLQLVVTSDPPGRLDLEKLKDVLLEAESRRPQP